MMNKKLLLLISVLGLCGQTVQAAHYAKKALSSAIALGYWGMLYDDVAKNIITDIRIFQNNDLIMEANPEYHVKDQEIIDLIYHEAQKRGIDTTKISVIKNYPGGVLTLPTGKNLASLFTENSYYLSIGSEAAKGTAPDSNKTNYMPDFNDEWIKPVLQHELNHIKHKDTAQRWATYASIPFVTHFITSRIFRIPYHMLGIYTFMRTTSFWHAIQKVCLLPTTLIATKSTIDLGWPKTIEYPLDRYQEKRADLNIDDDPEIIRGMISYFQSFYENQVKIHGKEIVDNFYKNAPHPHPLERIAYLTEKLNTVLEKQKQEQENK